MMEIRGNGKTDRGRRRPSNQDTYYVNDRLRLYLVCDGMGGTRGGGVAARQASEAVGRYLRRMAGDETPAFSSAVGEQTLVEIVHRAVGVASQAVRRAARRAPGCERMGTTLTMLLFTRTKAVMAHVGDSRLYRVRDGDACQLTTDQTLFEEMVAAGWGDADVPRRYQHILTSSIGRGQAHVQTGVFDVAPGDTYLLCTDGLCREVDVPGELTDALARGAIQWLPGQLVEMANARGGSDNITALVVRAGEEEPAPAVLS